MSVTILSGDFTVYFTDDTGGDKQIKWTGSSGTYTVNALYSALEDLFDNNTAGVGDYMDEGIPMSASTPTQYTIGKIETNDSEPWFIDPTSIKHLKSGAMTTTGWTYVSGSVNGVFRIPCSSLGTIVAGDVGNGVTTSAGSMTGTLLAVDTERTELWIRPTSSSATHNWASVSSGTITCNGHTATQNAAGVTGENEWANIFTIGTIVDNTRIYIYQNKVKITDWWTAGHIDVLILVTRTDSLIDYGTLIIFARQYTQLYDDSVVDASNGGRIPVAIATSADINNTTGYKSLTVSGVSGTFNAGNSIYFGASWAAATKKGVLTDVSGTTLTYYLIGDLTDFSNGNAITEWTGTANDATATVSGSTSDVGPAALATDPDINFGSTSQDIGDGGGNQPYDVFIDVQGNLLADFYEYTKYITRRGNTSDIDNDSGTPQTVLGESYITTGDIKFSYDTEASGPFSEGETITGSGGQEGVLTSLVDNGSTGTMVVRETRGTFVDPTTITGSTSGATAEINGTVTSITPSKTAPFGTFAGGKFFGARGVWIENMHANDANNYQLIDSNGVTRTPPSTYAISITALDVNNDPIQYAQVFVRKASSYYDYTSHNTNNSAGDTTFEVNETVDTDLPQTGWLHVFDASTNTKQNYRYASWSGLIFTLNTEVTGSATSTGSSTSLISTSTNFTTADIEEGDTIRNTTDGSWAVIDEIVDADNITTTALSGGFDNTWQSGDAFSLHKLAITYTNADKVDIPIFNAQTNASGVASTTYAGSVPISIVVRIRSNEGGTKFVPYQTTGTLSSSGFSLTAILTGDTVAT